MKGALRLVLLSALLAGCERIGYQLEFDRQELQAMVEEQFPLVKRNSFTELTFSAPVVQLDRGERLGLQLDVLASIFGSGPYKGQLALDGQLHYDTEGKAFFLYDARLNRFDLEGLSSGFAQQAEKLAGEMIALYLATQPLYRLDEGTIGGFFAQYTLKSVRVDGGRVLVQLGL